MRRVRNTEYYSVLCALIPSIPVVIYCQATISHLSILCLEPQALEYLADVTKEIYDYAYLKSFVALGITHADSALGYHLCLVRCFSCSHA